MATVAKLLGTTLTVVGVLVALVFGLRIARDEEFARAKLLLERNPGNVMYEAKLGGERVKQGFLAGGAIAGVLLALNGTTMLLLGIVAGRVKNG